MAPNFETYSHAMPDLDGVLEVTQLALSVGAGLAGGVVADLPRLVLLLRTGMTATVDVS